MPVAPKVVDCLVDGRMGFVQLALPQAIDGERLQTKAVAGMLSAIKLFAELQRFTQPSTGRLVPVTMADAGLAR